MLELSSLGAKVMQSSAVQTAMMNDIQIQVKSTFTDRDGTKIGFDNELLSTVSSSIDIPVIASGGVGNLEHFVEGVLKGGASALLAASIFHFGEYSIKDVKTYLAEQNIAVRI